MNTDNITPIAVNFYWWEVRCKHCGQIPSDRDVLMNVEHFAEKLQICRNVARRKFKINSWWRCSEHPLTLANPTSKHLTGECVDLYVPGWTIYQMSTFFIHLGFTGVGVYFDDGHVHIDLRHPPLYWENKKEEYHYVRKEELYRSEMLIGELFR